MRGKIWWIGTIGVVVLALAWVVYPSGSQPSKEEEKPANTKSHPEVPTPPPEFDVAAMESDLVRNGWSRAAAKEVVTLNTRFCQVLAEEDPTAFGNALARLRSLGKHPGLMDLLERRPEIAGLLAGALNPESVAAALRDDRQYLAITSVFARHAAEPDALAEAFRDHEPILMSLVESGIPGAEMVLMYPRTGQGADAYGTWLAEMLNTARRQGLEELTSALGFVLAQGVTIRRRMDDDAWFRERFGLEICPRFERLIEANHLSWEDAVWDEHLFDLLDLPEGEELVKRWGMLPSYVLFGPERYPAALHPQIIQAMLKGDNATLEALLDFGHLPLFRSLLARKGLDGETLARALKALKNERPVNVPAKLTFFAMLNDVALAAQLGPQPEGLPTWIPLYYTFYEVPKKLIQGRPVSTLEWIIAVVDPLLLGPLGADDVIKIAGKTATKEEAEQIVKTTLRNSAKRQASQQLGNAGKQLGSKELAPWQTMNRVRQRSGELLQKNLTVEITGPVRYFFRSTGMGRESFKRFTKLEARLFMRADARVFVQVDRFFALHRPLLHRFLIETAAAGGVESTLQTGPGEVMVATVVKGHEVADAQLTAWQQHVSAWWFIQTLKLEERSASK